MHCIVQNCNSSWEPNTTIKFHSFPRNIEKRNKWLSIVPIRVKLYNSARICSLHFKIADYDPRRPGHLLEKAVPHFQHTRVCDCVSSETSTSLAVSSPRTISTSHQDSLSGSSHITVFQQLPYKPSSLLCRFCAQTKLPMEVIDLSSDIIQKREIVENLSYFHSHNVDFTDESLPEIVCTVCRDTLTLCYRFLTKIRQSQTILHEFVNKTENDGQSITLHQAKEEPISDSEYNDDTDLSSQNEYCVVKEELDIEFDQEDPLYLVKKEFNAQDMDNMSSQAAVSTLQTKDIDMANESSSDRESHPILTNSLTIISQSPKDIPNESPILSNLLTTSTKPLIDDTSQIKNCLDNNPTMPRNEIAPKVLNIPILSKTTNINELEQTPPNTSVEDEKGDNLTELQKKSDNLNTHLNIANDNQTKKVFTGTICVNDLFTRYSSKEPKVTHTDRPRNLKCDECGKTFFNAFGLQQHSETHKYDPQMCTLCDKVFKNKNRLQRHINHNHSQIHLQ